MFLFNLTSPHLYYYHFAMKQRITFVGAGSTIFALTLLRDICAYRSLVDIEIILFDLDSKRLESTYRVALQLLKQVEPARNIHVRATLERNEALQDANFVLVMFQIGGYRPSTVLDFEIPKKYGLRQTIGDTLGIGGIMRALRTIPILLELTAELQRLAPNALLINYANPMAMNCRALALAGNVAAVGLCHSIPITTQQLADDLQLPLNEIDYLVAGINHLAFYLRLEHKGQDLYPALRAFMNSKRFPPHRPTIGKDMVDHLRYELMDRVGYFVTESSEHLSEYLPWFIKRNYQELVEQYQLPLDEYPRRCEAQIAEWQELQKQLAKDSAALEISKSNDYGIQIIESIINNHPRKVYANLPNRDSIRNLPYEAIVEIPALVDGIGPQPTQIGELPPQLAALIQSNINVQELTARAAVERRREYVYHAAMMDPHTAAELSLDEIYAMVDELLEAHGDYIHLD